MAVITAPRVTLVASALSAYRNDPPILLTASTTLPQGVSAAKYIWSKNNQLRSTISATKCSVSTAELGNYTYSVTILDSSGRRATSAPITITILEQPPIKIKKHPQNTSLYIGGDLLLNVEAESLSALTYQWLHNDKEIEGAVSASYFKANVTHDDLGVYSVILKDRNGSIMKSANAIAGQNIYVTQI
jgi:hypothetical protein